MLPRYHRAACGAMQLLSKGGAAPAEPQTQRAQVRQALEAALAEEGPEDSLEVPEALRAEERGSKHGSSIPMPTSKQLNDLKETADYWVSYFATKTKAVSAALSNPSATAKKS